MNSDLFLSILAMNSYNHGYSEGINNISKVIRPSL